MSPQSPSPLSEGEIVSEDEEKAISTNKTDRDSKVNTSTRHHRGSSSRAAQLDPDAMFGVTRLPYGGKARNGARYASRSRSPSPYRASRPGSSDKRRHEDDHYNHNTASDSRRFKVTYEDDRTPRGRGLISRRPHLDNESSDNVTGRLSYDDYSQSMPYDPYSRNSRASGLDRDRSPSPYRHSASARSKEPFNASAESNGKAAASAPLYSERESTPNNSARQEDAKIKMSLTQHTRADGQGSSEGRLGDEANSAEQESASDTKKDLSEAELIEQRRKRREAIKAKHKSNPPLLVQALEQNTVPTPSTPVHDSSGAPSTHHSPPSSMDSPRTPHKDSPPDSPAAFVVNDDEELADRRNTDTVHNDDEGPSAADYDPNQDMEEDRPDHKRQDLQETNAKGAPQESEPAVDARQETKEFDMFADDDDDMFAPTDSAAKPAIAAPKQAKALDQSLLDNWDYPDGHYRIILGELLDGRYAVQQQIGKGTFATVVRAQDTKTGDAVAVKIACNNETMYKAGQKEMDVLQLLNQKDPEDKKHIIRMLRNFDHKGHMCLVFENLSADLREVLKKFGRNVGLNLKAIRSYGQQVFLALSHMKKCEILHADLKPDNILVSEKRNLLKVCDLGTAVFADNPEVTPYLVSRFYRAPEVILGIPFDYAIDMWSIGCTLFELYTGRILFAGSDNNQMLRAIQECRGKFPIRMLKRGTLADKHFDFDGNFFSQERDKMTGKATMRQLNFAKIPPGKDLRARLSGNTKGMRPEEIKEHAAFVDLMEKCLQLDPVKRISPNDALRHGFITHGGASQQEKPSTKMKVAMNVPRVR